MAASPWVWSPLVHRLVRQAVLGELVASTVRLQTANGVTVATANLSGDRDTVVVRASADGKLAKAVLANRRGDELASAPAKAVCDRVDVQQGAEITVRFALP